MSSEFITLAGSILSTVKLAFDVVKMWREHTVDAERKAGTQKLYLALCATTDYIENTHDLRDNHDRAIEQRLDQMWRDAARAVAPIKLSLADRLYLKADYWRNPDSFKESKTAQAELDEAKISLKDIRKEILDLL